MTIVAEYTKGADLPDIVLDWRDHTGALIPFATGHTFEVKVGERLGQPALLTKTSGITGADTSPNIRIQWLPQPGAELDLLDPGTYAVQVAAIRTSDGKRRYYPTLPLVLKPAIS
jgi:hypothetical protein